jgi:Flp pilus assembly protein TadG
MHARQILANRSSGKKRGDLQSGQSVVEFALILPVLLLLSLGVIEVGRFAYISILVANAARAGAAYGAQSLTRSADTAGISTAAKNDFLSNGQTSLTVTSAPTCGCDSNGTTTSAACTGVSAGSCPGGGHWVVLVRVTAGGTYNSLFNYPGIPRNMTLSNTAIMRVQQD